ncbi:hypothetical protein [Romboutsia timonensis]|uniref:hypothetical protein n=1 Tax=Romboutsia timonensis TaxID=1776391 RepID=UPI001C174E7D|nr:hypothetical protein [Romboutsia timonensis]MDY3960548.1 hypothetical protein [Romboutsia timonensis]HBF6648937.1 hypothetical protein [Clostridioides difficile]
MSMDMIEILEIMEEQRREEEYMEMQFNDWLDKVQKREEFINSIDLAEIECITSYWKPTEAVRYLSRLVTMIVTM